MSAGAFLLVTIGALIVVVAGFHLRKKMKLARRQRLRPFSRRIKLSRKTTANM